MTEHSHNLHRMYETDKRALILVLGITFSVMFIEVLGGWISGSLALLSDAGHMFTDSSALLLALFALWFAQKPVTAKRTFGFYRLEILAALVNGAFLFFIAAYIIMEGINRFLNPQEVKGLLMMVVGGAGLIANITSAYILSKTTKESLNLNAAFWHVLSDTVSSIGVIISAIIIFLTGWTIADPLISFFIAILILRGAWRIVSESTDILLEAVPKDIDVNKIANLIKNEVPGIKEVHDLHVWTITSGLRALSAHILVEDRLVSECGSVSTKIKEILKERYNINHPTLEFECDTCTGGMVCTAEEKEKINMAKDLVCGMDVPEGKNAVEYEGKTYSFCSENCKKSFELDPKKYIRIED